MFIHRYVYFHGQTMFLQKSFTIYNMPYYEGSIHDMACYEIRYSLLVVNTIILTSIEKYAFLRSYSFEYAHKMRTAAK